MVIFLRGLFLVVLGSMLWVTSWASLHQSLGAFAHSATIRDPWVIATLFDAYWGFIAFFVWVAWKERRALTRVLWFVSLIALGNIAIASFMLAELFRVRTSDAAPLDAVFTRRHAGSLVLPGVLTGFSLVIYCLT